MNILLSIVIYCLFIVFSPIVHAHAQEESHIHHDPFKNPLAIQSKPPITIRVEERQNFKDNLKVKSVLVAGEKSLVNIDGNILQLGDDYKGHTLKSVREGVIVFARKKKEIVIRLDDYEKNK